MDRRWLIGVGVGVVLALALCAGAAAAKDKGKGSDRVLSKVTFIHYRRGNAKPPWAGGGGTDKQQTQGSYTYIAKGAHWRTTEPFLLNPEGGENPDGDLDGLIAGAFGAGMDEWEAAGGSGLDIYGPLIIDPSVTYDDGAYRGYNTFSFGPYGDSNVIAITTVWGYFGGRPADREIIEAHILMNDEYAWGDATDDADGDGSPDTYLMDVQNIATHELGHVAGMGDLYESGASDETMYGYSTEGETKKRDLYTGDIAGVTALYQ